MPNAPATSSAARPAAPPGATCPTVTPGRPGRGGEGRGGLEGAERRDPGTPPHPHPRDPCRVEADGTRSVVCFLAGPREDKGAAENQPGVGGGGRSPTPGWIPFPGA